jgi:hypothetical protein
MTHSLGHTVFAHLAASILKLLGELGASVASFAAVIDFPDFFIKFLGTKLPLGSACPSTTGIIRC